MKPQFANFFPPSIFLLADFNDEMLSINWLPINGGGNVHIVSQLPFLFEVDIFPYSLKSHVRAVTVAAWIRASCILVILLSGTWYIYTSYLITMVKFSLLFNQVFLVSLRFFKIFCFYDIEATLLPTSSLTSSLRQILRPSFTSEGWSHIFRSFFCFQ